MSRQVELFPSGLPRSQFSRLNEYVNRASTFTPVQLLEEANIHFQETYAAYQKNRMINLRLAKAIRDTIEKVVSDWNSLPAPSQSWLAGAILYFAKSNDDVPDFTSPLGFEDDVEILNACLKFAQLDKLCLNPEDYDDV
jgi:uncharacterized membrane protein YkvA (DUF1232 family)